MQVKNLSDRRFGLWIIIGLIAALYFLTLIRNHTESDDGLWYMYVVSYCDITYQFNPHNLFYCIINYLFYNFWRFCGYPGSSEITMEFLNVIAGACVLLGVYFFTVKLKFPRILILFCLATTAFSYAFWKYSVDCEAYIFPIIFILLAFHRFTQIQKSPLVFKNHVLLGIFNAMAILMHLQHILLVFVVLFGYGYIFISAKNKNDIKSYKFLVCILLYLIVCLSLVLFAYVLVAIFVKGFSKYSDILKWSMMYVNIGNWGWEISAIPETVAAFSRAFVGGHFIYAIPWVKSLLLRMFPEYLLREEIYLVSHFSILQSLILSLLFFAFLGTLIYVTLYLIKCKSLKLLRNYFYDQGQFLFLLIFCVYIAVYTLFAMALRPVGTRFFCSINTFRCYVIQHANNSGNR